MLRKSLEPDVDLFLPGKAGTPLQKMRVEDSLMDLMQQVGGEAGEDIRKRET